MISEHYQERWTRPLYRESTLDPIFIPRLPSLAEYEEFQELLRKAREYDKRMQQPDCPDPAKEKWMAELEKVMVKKYDLKPKKPSPKTPKPYSPR
jgi:hypothetical protein